MSRPAKLTPMLKQYYDLKDQYPDCILFFRLGDFYEMFGEDAVEVSKLLSITLTARGKDESRIDMCGVPHHAAKRYIARLTRLGKRVAMCEQITDPNLPGIVERDVVRVVSPGTTFDDYVLDSKSNNYIASLSVKADRFGLSLADLTTGEFMSTELNNFYELETELNKLRPSELILANDLLGQDRITKFLDRFDFIHLTPIQIVILQAKEFLIEHFKVQNLMGFSLEEMPLAIESAANLLNYLKKSQKSDLDHIQGIKKYNIKEFMALDESTVSNLELMFTMREAKREGSLLSVLDKTLTSMGGRMLRSWLLKPLIDQQAIELRLEAVAEIYSVLVLQSGLQELLKEIMDIERILGRLGCNSANARDLLALKSSLQIIPKIKELIQQSKAQFLQTINQNLNDFEDLVNLLGSALLDEPAATVREGNMIKDGFNQELDELKTISRSSKEMIQKLQKQEIDKTGISSLKVRFNRIFGYYIEISKAHLAKVPADYIRRQTMTNAERYITPELKEYEEKILGAQEKMIELEYDLFINLQCKIASQISKLQQAATMIAYLDVLHTFAFTAKKRNYTRPEFNNENSLNIQAGRHPVVEAQTEANDFVPNDLELDHRIKQIALITGPNMAGKSTYLRQAALIVLMAQIGSFVPASKADLSVCDRIFTRVGASDNLVKGQSTFMVEMQEAANILHNASNRSLIILDEIGRGTSTYDGISIAWAIFEYLHDQIGAKTLFASHYHELIKVAEDMPRAFNLSVAVKEKEDGVVFLHKVVAGGVDKSYGIEVAKLAGLPSKVIARANGILMNLEDQASVENSKKVEKKDSELENQLSFFSHQPQEHRALKALKDLDPNMMTPLEALQKLMELKDL